MGNNGPHGMHAVTDLDPVAPAKADDRWNFAHKNYRNDGPGCDACHGDDLKGTVLSRTADDRTVWCKDNKAACQSVLPVNRQLLFRKERQSVVVCVTDRSDETSLIV